MSHDDDYLWDGSGEPDDDVKHLEEVLAPLRYDGDPPDLAPRRGPWVLRALAVAAALVIVVWGFPRGQEQQPRIDLSRVQSATVGWAFRDARGAVRVGNRPIDPDWGLFVGEWLETGDDAGVRLAVADIGSLDVGERTRLRIRNTGKDQHRLQLAHGRISARVNAPPRLFVVDTASATAVDLGCAYTLEADEEGNGRLEVTSGEVALELGERSSIVPANATCELRARLGPGTPHYTDAPEKLVAALGEIDFVPNCGNEALTTVLESARERDGLTLWHLLPRVPKPDRGAVFDRMNALSAAPEGVTREGVLRLDREMLDAWREHLDWDW